jgi:hypothetical protein
MMTRSATRGRCTRSRTEARPSWMTPAPPRQPLDPVTRTGRAIHQGPKRTGRDQVTRFFSFFLQLVETGQENEGTRSSKRGEPRTSVRAAPRRLKRAALHRGFRQGALDEGAGRVSAYTVSSRHWASSYSFMGVPSMASGSNSTPVCTHCSNHFRAASRLLASRQTSPA